jgi:ABC-type branched-subunit amino acid transport system ATPase component
MDDGNKILNERYKGQYLTETPVLLKATGICKSFGGQSVLKDLNFELREGEIVLLRGENGSGKTTLLNILTGNIEADKGILHYNMNDKPFQFAFPISWWKKLNALDHFSPEFVAKKGITRTWQDIRLFNSQSLKDNITVAYTNQTGENPFFALVKFRQVKRQELETTENATKLLESFDLVGLIKNKAGKISLGQSKRLAIARAVATGARILLMDEPFSGLDLNGISSMIDFLKKLSLEKKITIVIIEHFLNIPLVSSLATIDWYLENGNLTISPINHSNLKTGITKNNGNQFSFLEPKNADVSVHPLPNDATLIRIRPHGFDESKADVILELKKLQVMRGTHKIEWKNSDDSFGLSLKVYRGEVILFQAANGWGKTTLVDTISGEIPKLSGDIIFQCEHLNKTSYSHELARKGMQVILASNNLFTNISGKEMLKLAKATKIIKGVESLLSRPINQLSGGQRQRIALATIQNARNKHLVLYDEPFSGLDIKSISLFEHLFHPDPSCVIIIFLPSYY